MEDVENYITDPGAEDVRVDEVFTPAMFNRVMARLKGAGVGELETVGQLWETDYRSRRVVSGFLRDAEIGKKRLASMPDRVTNTLRLPSGETLFRPTVINCYEQDFTSLDDWFEQWLSFFFDQQVDMNGKGPKAIYSLLQPIRKSKYPAVTEEEEKASVPLQLLMQGVFDAILVNLLLTKGGSTWQQIRREICQSLNSRKNGRILDILSSTYQDADVVFLQEASGALVEMLRERHSGSFQILVPRDFSSSRSQNSVIMLRSRLFAEAKEVVMEAKGWDAGDLLIVEAKVPVPGRTPTSIALASFHGDTNGLLTIPVLKEVMANLPAQLFVFGLDANTYNKKSSSTAYVMDFEGVYKEFGLQACWGAVDPSRVTTFHARTYLQPQLNKATKSSELLEKGDVNLKDFILFTKHFTSAATLRDNTGRREYIEGMVFPTLEFPSDHAAISTDLFLRTAAVSDEL